MSNNAERKTTHHERSWSILERMRLLCDELEQELKGAEYGSNDGKHTGTPELQDQRQG